MVDTQRNKANLQRLYDEVMNGHDVDAADDLVTLDRPTTTRPSRPSSRPVAMGSSGSSGC